MAEPEPAAGLVLVVDDEPLNRDLLRRLLAPEFAIVDAPDAEQALALLERRGAEIRVVLCDQLMPGRIGTELAAEVRARWPDKVFYLLTGYEDDAEVRRAVATGLVNRVIAKPWTGSALRRLLRAALGR